MDEHTWKSLPVINKKAAFSTGIIEGYLEDFFALLQNKYFRYSSPII